MIFDRDRVKRRGAGRYEVKLRPSARVLMGDLVVQLREQLLASTDDPSVRRLFPPAYPDDPDHFERVLVQRREAPWHPAHPARRSS